MEIIVINPNTDPTMTAALAAAAKGIAPPDSTITAVTAPFGAPLLTRRRDVAVASNAVLALVVKHAGTANAFVVASFSDPGLEAAREVAAVPVVALCEAATHHACQLGSRIGLLLSAPEMIPVIEEKLRAYGIADRVCGIRAPPAVSAPAGPKAGKDQVIDTYVKLGQLLIEEARAEVLVTGGGPLIGLVQNFQERLPVPVIDAVDCAVLEAYVLARLNPKKPVVGSYCYPPKVAAVGVDGSLRCLFHDT